MTAAVIFALHEVHNELPMSPWAYGGIALAILAILVLVTMSYGSVANRHAEKAEQWAKEHGGQEHGHH